MKRKTKIMISSLLVMFVAAIAVAIASFSFAGNDDANPDSTVQLADAGSDAVDWKTIIDYIIDNSNSTDSETDKVYHIAEITSNKPSSLQNYCSGEESDFKKYVIDGNRSSQQETVMAKKCVEYKCFSGSTKKAEDLAYVSNADLIYISNDSLNQFSKTNDISEDLYDVLHKYAVGDFKPLIIDSPTANTVESNDGKTMADIITLFDKNEVYYFAFAWKTNMTADQYLSHKAGSLYLGINGLQQRENNIWVDVRETASATTEAPTTETSTTETSSTEEQASSEQISSEEASQNVQENQNSLSSEEQTVNSSNETQDSSEEESDESENESQTLTEQTEASETEELTVESQSVSANPSTEATTTESSKMAKILTINTTGSKTGTYTKTSQLLAGCPDVAQLYNNANQSLQPTDSVVYKKLDPGSLMYIKGYTTRSKGIRPDYIENDIVALENADQVNFDQYDMVVIENDCNNQPIGSTLYTKLAAAMYGQIHIVYSSDGTSDDSDQPIEVDNKRETNYLDLFYLIATEKYVTKYSSVMVTNRNDFNIITTSKSAQTAKVIADLINASTYRGIGGSGSAASMFTVLELQPCYPVDQEVAKNIGENNNPRKSDSGYENYYGNDNYYTEPADMIDGKTKEQLPENTEYYAWELSKAKLSDTLGIPYSKINLVQMSTEEFACDKTDILGTYDMVYIGGNTSALKSLEHYMDVAMFTNTQLPMVYKQMKENGQTPLNIKVGDNQFNLDILKYLPIYTMYSHNGDMVAVNKPHNEKVGGSVLAAQVQLNGSYKDSFTMLNGNDITYNRYLDLKEYIESGMPVVISSDLTNAYKLVNEAKDADGQPNPYLQNSIDPDSNMYKVLNECSEQTQDAKSGKIVDNIAWGFQADQVVDVLSDGTLGETLTGYVSVFASTQGSTSDSDPAETDSEKTVVKGSKEDLASVYQRSKKRPKLVLTRTPAIYNRYDDTTKIKDHKLSFVYSVVTDGDYTANLYIDDDGNSKFSSSKELFASQSSKEGNILTYQCADSFFGPVYWKLEVVDENGVAVSQTGLSYIQSATNKPQEVNVLQIMPEGGGGQRGYDSLYFCPQCQQAGDILEYNPYVPESQARVSNDTYYLGSYKDSKSDQYNQNGWQNGTYKRGNTTIYIGEHQHTFGICAYDSERTVGQYTGVDNFDVNLADEIKGSYDFHVDIMRRSEFEKLAEDVRSAYNYQVNSKGEIGSEALSQNDILAGAKNPESPYYIAETDSAYNEFLSVEAQPLSEKYTQEMKTNALCTVVLSNYYEKQAASNLTTYNTCKKISLEKKNKLDKAFKKMLEQANKDNAQSIHNQFFNSDITLTEWKTELQCIIDSGHYSDYYFICKGEPLKKDISSAYLQGCQVTYKNKEGNDVTESVSEIDSLIKEYYESIDNEKHAREVYQAFTRYAAGTNWLEACYDTISFGPSENFNGDDIKDENALDDLEKYVEAGNQVILFHDTLSPMTDYGATNLTKRLRPYFGLDRYHMQTTAEKAIDEDCFGSTSPLITDNDSYYVNYKSQDPDRYFMTNLSWRAKNWQGDAQGTINRYNNWQNDMNVVVAQGASMNINRYLTDVAYTDSFNYGPNLDTNRFALPYKYADFWYQRTTNEIQDTNFTRSNFKGKYGTDRASQNNEGIITMYPFTIAKDIYVGPTHGQAYAADVEDDNMTIWYSLAGGYGGKSGSSIYAASPRDGVDNYYLYSYKNVFYCGAGHSDITGKDKDNNDERYLFINIMCNSVRPSIQQPGLTIHDYDEKEGEPTNKIITFDGSMYNLQVDENMDYPEFNFKVVTDPDAKVSNVKIYYDLDYTEGGTTAYNADKDVLIADWNSDKKNIQSGQNTHVFRYDATLEKLMITNPDNESQLIQKKEDYFIAAGETDVLTCLNDSDQKIDTVYYVKSDEENAQLDEIKSKAMAKNATLVEVSQSKMDEMLSYFQKQGYVEYNQQKVLAVRSVAATKLKLLEKYFEPYKGDCTYIVVEVTDSKNQTIRQRLRIKAKPHLFDLT